MTTLKNIGSLLSSLLAAKPSAVCNGDSIQVERRHQQRQLDNSYIADLFIGQRYIFVPNEWENPSIGIIESVDLVRGVVCHGFDYVSNEPEFFTGFPMHYNPQRLAAILKLDPFERYSLCRHNPQIPTPIEKPIHTTVLTGAEIMKRLKQNGFPFEEET